MTKEQIKHFVKEHKGEIIIGSVMAIGAVALTAIGIKCEWPTKIANWRKGYTDACTLMYTVGDCCEGCNTYDTFTAEELQNLINSGLDLTNTQFRDNEGNKILVKNIIMFGEEIKP